MKTGQNLETFRCSCTERGRQCASDFTRANAFAQMLKTLERKNPGGVTEETIAANAICPFHARILSDVRTDVVRMDEVLDKYFRIQRELKQEEQERMKRVLQWQHNQHRRFTRTSDFGQKLKLATAR